MKKAKTIKSFFSIFLTVFLTMIMATTAFSAGKGSVTVRGLEEGKTYELYKILDLTQSGNAVSYTIASDWIDFFSENGSGAEFIVETNSGDLNPITLDGKTKYINITEENVADFAQKALIYAVDKTPVSTHVANESDVTSFTFSGLDLGYYLVYPKGATEVGSGNASICSLTSTTPDGTVDVKATHPDITKEMIQVENRDPLPEGTTITDANVGDTVSFEINGNVPDMTGFKTYKYCVEDTMSKGLTFDSSSVSVTIGGSILDAGDYTVTTTDISNGTKFQLVISDMISYQNQKGAEIEITYDAVLNEQADTVIFDTNTAKLIYSNDPKNFPQNPDNPPEDSDVNGETPEQTTYVYSTKLELTKVDGAEPSKTLQGAKFSIVGNKRKTIIVNREIYKESLNGTWYRLKDGTYTQTEAVSDTENKYENTSVKYELVSEITTNNKNEPFVAEGWVDADGKITFNGLGEGEYTITELVSPEGYNKLASPIEVVVTFNVTNEVKGEGEFTATVNGDNASVDNGVIKFNVKNNSGTLLPSTGGIGETIFYILGSILVLGATLIIIYRKRINKEA
ncbi:hypothetical protein IGI96_003602 [Enterococcus sp. DIV0421]|uniref:SpaH/EbpB family LPXTG-anchored major pilin n=1 Tax=Enterococcus sp. DIV0421 TaxID=2774688 RepID=UPI003F2067BC